MSKYDLLLSPFKLGNLTLKNRIISAPTSLAEMGTGGVFSPENAQNEQGVFALFFEIT